ncbi:hypothetical protein [Porphyromonas pogonae]|uniref:hypothetical protein n=1 Tax=Porphyromonas pogonae TaxID=867595 RepID=UPI002E78D79B|nr:hypothetical protein [Porphyromonas pogonae]
MKSTKTLRSLAALSAVAAFSLFNSVRSYAQGIKDYDFDISGYIQADVAYGQKYARSMVGEIYRFNGQANKDFWRAGIARGLVRAAVTRGEWQAVAQINMTENKIRPYSMFIKYSPDYLYNSNLIVGLQDQIFGQECPGSSKYRESPERSIFISDLFNGVIELGARAHWAPKQQISGFNQLGFDLMVTGGNSGGAFRKNTPDVIAKLILGNTGDKTSWQLGGSAYIGNVPQVDEQSNIKRQYWGAYGEFKQKWAAGITSLRGEMITGWQPGRKNSNTVTGQFVTTDQYFVKDDPILKRHFLGVSSTFMHELPCAPLQAVVKFYHYDRNTKLSANDIAAQLDKDPKSLNAYNEGTHNVWGFGLNYWLANRSVRLTAYYEKVDHQKINSKNTIYSGNVNDDTFTFRMQYIF